MKEIHFRAFFDKKLIHWNDKDKGFYVSPTAGAPSIVLVFDPTNEPHFIGEGRLESLMQFTGLKDKEGKQIWEGDIVECFGRNPKPVEKDFYELTGPDNAIPCHTAGGVVLTTDAEQYKVVGNIFDNPELLK